MLRLYLYIIPLLLFTPLTSEEVSLEPTALEIIENFFCNVTYRIYETLAYTYELQIELIEMILEELLNTTDFFLPDGFIDPIIKLFQLDFCSSNEALPCKIPLDKESEIRELVVNYLSRNMIWNDFPLPIRVVLRIYDALSQNDDQSNLEKILDQVMEEADAPIILRELIDSFNSGEE